MPSHILAFSQPMGQVSQGAEVTQHRHQPPVVGHLPSGGLSIQWSLARIVLDGSRRSQQQAVIKDCHMSGSGLSVCLFTFLILTTTLEAGTVIIPIL